jgi:hypothetical protein
MVYDPPPGYVDMLDDAEREGATVSHLFHDLDVKDVGIVRARKPMPNSVAALSMAANSTAGKESQADYLVLFVQNHLEPGEMDRILWSMVMGEMPAVTLNLISQAICTWGTPRPM